MRGVMITDLNGDGRVDVVISHGSATGLITLLIQSPGPDLDAGTATISGTEGEDTIHVSAAMLSDPTSEKPVQGYR